LEANHKQRISTLHDDDNDDDDDDDDNDVDDNDVDDNDDDDYAKKLSWTIIYPLTSQGTQKP
jgi:hypothetical protein